MGHPFRHDKGGQGGGSTSPMEERISWLIAQGKVMLGLYRKARTPGEKEQIRSELASLYRQLAEVSPVLSSQRRFQDLLTLLQIQLEITRIFGGKQTEGVILGNIGYAYLALRQYKKALESLEQAILFLQATGNQVSLCNALFGLGEACRLLQRYDEALRLYEQALAIDPDRSTCWFVKGDVLERLGRREEAITSYKHSLGLKPDLEPARKALSRLGIST